MPLGSGGIVNLIELTLPSEVDGIVPSGVTTVALFGCEYTQKSWTGGLGSTQMFWNDKSRCSAGANVTPFAVPIGASATPGLPGAAAVVPD